MQQTSVQKNKKNLRKLGGMNMFKKMKHIKNEKGLTLIELLAVIVILAIIAAIAIPAIGNIINNTRDKAVLSDVQSAVAAAKIAKADGSCDAPTSAGTVCKPGQYEFKSDKFTQTTSSPTITVTFNAAGDASVTATLAKKLSGTKISGSITTNGGTIGSENTPALAITESQLNKVLGGN